MNHEEFYNLVKAAYENKDYFAEEIVSIIGGALRDVKNILPTPVHNKCTCTEPKPRWKESTGWYCGICFKPFEYELRMLIKEGN